MWFRHDGVSWVPSAPLHPWYRSSGPAPVVAPARRSRTQAALGVTAGVVVVVAVLLAALLQSAPGGGADIGGTADPSVVQAVTHIPRSVYDQVGTVPTDQVAPPTVVSGHAALRVGGKPGVFFFGAEFCPYCATERWAIVAALSRFGTWQGLRNMASSTTDVYPGTETFTFRTASFRSPYIGVELEEAVDRADHTLQPPTSGEAVLLREFDVTGYPFMDIGNRVLVRGAGYSPARLEGLSRAQIANGLRDPGAPATEGIVATANYLSAGICAVDGGRPASVCQDPAVTTAAASLGLAT
jgi:hypothetical protein